MTGAPHPLSLDAVNALPRDGFVTALATVFEYSPWVADSACAARPFASVAAIHDSMMQAVRTAPTEQQLALIRGHPELGSRVGRAGLTAESQAEQGSLGLDRLSAEEFSRFHALNAAYRRRFGFPFIICVRRHTRDSILCQFERRLNNSADAERAVAIEEIGLITRLRLVDRVNGPGKPQTDGRLTTHVLDLATGTPAAGVAISLFEVGASARGLLMNTITNDDGRTDEPLIAGAPLRIGCYELQFDVGGYYRSRSCLFGLVPLRFSIAEPEAHYHVPLLMTPWSITTYRGS